MEQDSDKGGKRKMVETDNPDVPSSSQQTSQHGDSSTTPTKKSVYNYWTDPPIEGGTDSICTLKNLVTGICAQQLKFRTTYKSSIRKTQGGQVFSFHIMDSTSEIGVTAFDKMVEQYYSVLQVNHTYQLENFIVKLENPTYKSGTGHKLQIVLNNSSKITEVENDGGVPEIPFKFVAFADLPNCQLDSHIDVLGVFVRDFGIVGDPGTRRKRIISIADPALPEESPMISLWPGPAELFNADLYSVIAFRRLLVSEFKENKTFNLNYTSLMWVNPDIPPAYILKEKFAIAKMEKEKLDAAKAENARLDAAKSEMEKVESGNAENENVNV